MYSYVEHLLAAVAPDKVPLLGLRWSFGFPHSTMDTLTEYSLPFNPEPILDALDRRGGIHIDRHIGDTPQSLQDHLATGRPAIVAVDAYYLPFRPAYRRIHSSRAVLVRAGRTTDEAFIQDHWGPATESVLDSRILAFARYSDVPLDAEREPLFAGRPLAGEWFSVEVSQAYPDHEAEWVPAMIATLHREMTRSLSDVTGTYGFDGLDAFRRWLNVALESPHSEDGVFRRRVSCLLLRVEISSRLYLCAFLRAASRRLGDSFLGYEADAYRHSLGHMQSALDVLTKTLRVQRREYDDFVRVHLQRASDVEHRIADALSQYDSPP